MPSAQIHVIRLEGQNKAFVLGGDLETTCEAIKLQLKCENDNLLDRAKENGEVESILGMFCTPLTSSQVYYQETIPK